MPRIRVETSRHRFETCVRTLCRVEHFKNKHATPLAVLLIAEIEELT